MAKTRKDPVIEVECKYCGKKTNRRRSMVKDIDNYHCKASKCCSLYMKERFSNPKEREKQSERLKKAWDDGKFDKRDHEKTTQRMRAGWTKNHDEKISQSVKELYKNDEEKKYGFRAVKDRTRSENQRRILSEYSLRQWQNMTVEEQKERIRKLREGFRNAGGMLKIIKFDGKTFYHPNEVLCYNFLRGLGIKKKEIDVNFSIQLKEIDFFIRKTFFWEHHVCNVFDRLTKEEYFEKRRAILDKNNYMKYPLIVTTSNSELNDQLKEQIIELLKGEKVVVE